jgi:hydroxymethylpyrimidine pyrophosphatase-like HAD family hydrolase
MVCSNGCVIVRLDPHFGAGYWIEQVSTFDAEPLIREIAAHLPTARFAVEDVGRGYRVSQPFNEGELAGEYQIVPFEQLAGGGLVTRVVIRGGDETPEEFSAAIAKLGMTGVGYFVGYNAWMDLVPAGVSKASALEHVREKLAIPTGHTMAVGDGHNDIDMIKWAARGIAMGQADLEVRMAADEVTAPVTKNGVAAALRPILPTH